VSNPDYFVRTIATDCPSLSTRRRIRPYEMIQARAHSRPAHSRVFSNILAVSITFQSCMPSDIVLRFSHTVDGSVILSMVAHFSDTTGSDDAESCCSHCFLCRRRQHLTSSCSLRQQQQLAADDRLDIVFCSSILGRLHTDAHTRF
jgi:hypothetical protein